MAIAPVGVAAIESSQSQYAWHPQLVQQLSATSQESSTAAKEISANEAHSQLSRKALSTCGNSRDQKILSRVSKTAGCQQELI
ncbi:hypothetical protein HNP40_001013 [Mycobacteroides chelonae]|nr:hypothetical protein [Mycobacteroides chelonae]